MLEPRKLGAHHFAFYRGWLQGIELRTLADLYLETGLDLRLAKRTLQWIKDTLRQAAIRHGKHSEARLLKLSLGTAQAEELPSLDVFREQHDPDGFYSEKELIAEYLAAYPAAADPKARKRKRLIKAQLDALTWIEALVVTQPDRRDPVRAWFDETVAKRMILAGILTLADLIERIETKGNRWWTTVPKLGEKGAARIMQWLQGYESALGKLSYYALVPARSVPVVRLLDSRPKETGIAPIERLVLPEGLDGTGAANRCPLAPQTDAKNDLEAINAWLSVKAGSKNTERVYRKEAERLLLWAVMERGKPLSGLNVDDCVAYRNWLSMLGRTEPSEWPFNMPQEEWIAPRYIPRYHPDWRPFDGPLSTASVKHAVTILSSFFAWLVAVQYCNYNHWLQVSKKIPVDPNEDVDLELTRVFSQGQWEFLINHLNAMPQNAHTERLRLLMAFAVATGLRASELADAKLGRFYTMPLSTGTGVRWMLKVLGKGSVWRAVPLTDEIMQKVFANLEHRGLNPDPKENPPETPLIARLDGKGAVSYSTVYRLMDWLFNDAANCLVAAGKTHDAKAFREASTHWIRHTCGNMLAMKKIPTNVIQKLLGHKSISTTGIYTESSAAQLWEVLNSLESAA